MNTNSAKIMPTNEVIGALLLPYLSAEDIELFRQDAEGFLKSKIAFDFTASITIVENDASTVNLALPYYSQVEMISSVELTPEQMEEVQGGEIVITLGVTLGGLAGLAVAVGVGGYNAGLVLSSVCIITGTVIGGVLGSAILIGSVVDGLRTAGVIGGNEGDSGGK